MFGLINQISQQQEDGLLQAQAIALMLLNFAERNPGMTRVLIGDVLVNEDDRLQIRMNQFMERLELAFKQALRLAVTQNQAAENEVSCLANLLCSVVVGRWHRYAKTGFKNLPGEQAALQLALLLR